VQSRPGTQPGTVEARAPRSLEECLKALEPLAAARGHLVATDGVSDLRLSVERGQVDLELMGPELPRGKEGDAAVVRAVLDTMFWESPLYDVSVTAPVAVPEGAKPRPRVQVARPEAAKEICRTIAEEVSKLDATRRRVPSLAVAAAATATSRDAKGGSPIAVKLRGALVASNRGDRGAGSPTAAGEIVLADWAREQGQSFVDVATAFAELLDANEAKVARKLDAASSPARIDAALKGGGFCPGLRAERAARALLAARDAGRACGAFCRAGHERLASGRVSEALDCFQVAASIDPVALPDKGIAAREGLLLALGIEAKDPRRPAGAESRPQQELKRVALDLGQLYFSLGLMNRARGALELSLDDTAPLELHFAFVDALLGAGQLGKALDRAEALAPRLDRARRRALACKLLESGPKGPSLDRAHAIAGVRGERRVTNVALGTAAAFTLIAIVFGLQGAAASSLATASADAKQLVQEAGPTTEIAARLRAIGSRYPFAPAGAKAARLANRVDDLAADAKWLAEHRAALAWASSPDPDQARARIRAVIDGARTDALRASLNGVLAALDKMVQQCRGEIDSVRGAADVGDGISALEGARRVREHFPAWKSLWRDVKVPIRVNVERPDDAIVEINGERIQAVPPVLYLALEPGVATIAVHGEAGSGWIPQTLRVELDTVPSVVSVALQRDPSAPPIVKRTSNPVAPPPSDTPAPPPGTPTNPGETVLGKRGGKISIGGDATPEKPQATADGGSASESDGQSEKKNKFEVREVMGSDVQKLLGGASPVDIPMSAGYFDFLAAELPRDGRLRMSLDVLTRVRDRKVFLDGVRLRLFDTVLGHTIPPRDVMLDDPVERPVQGTSNGHRAVLGLDRCINLDQAKWKAQVRDGLVQMIRDFNKREGE
jgi:tetratricopeptide (TPR) repeat protein